MTAGGQGERRRDRREGGYALAVLLVSIAVMGILMSVAMPAWKHAIQREREAELVFRGEQYARAVGLFQRKFAGAFPPSVDLLVEQRFLRRRYKDPITNGDFQVLYTTSVGQPGQVPGSATRPGQPTPASPPAATPPQSAFGGSSTLAGPRGGVIGVTSKSTEKSIRLYKGRGKYNEWQFVYTAVATGPGVPRAPGRPGMPTPGLSAPGIGRPGQPTTTFPGRPGLTPFPPSQQQSRPRP